MAIIPGLEKYNLLLLLQTFRFWISTSTALNTSTLCRHYTRTSLLIKEVPGQRVVILKRVVIIWFIGFNGAVHWSLRRRGLGVSLSGLAFVTSPISIIEPWCTLSRISTHHWVGPRKSVSNRAPHLLTPALTAGTSQCSTQASLGIATVATRLPRL